MSLRDKFKGRWVVKPTESMIKQMGRAYEHLAEEFPGANDESVKAYIHGTVMYALVDVDYDEQQVVVRQVDGNRLSTDCSCRMPTYMFGDVLCIHAAAALRYLADNFERLVSDSYVHGARVEAMLGRITREQAMAFLSAMLTADAEMYSAFVEKFDMDGVRVKRDYGLVVDRLYYAAMDSRQRVGENLDFGDYFRMAGGSGGAESADAYRAMSESIYRNMHMVDDSDGYYTDCLVESIENMAESVLQLPDKREHMEYLAAMMAESPPDLSRHYRSALETVCVSGGELDHLYGFLQKLLDGDREPGQVAEITRMQIHVLEERDGDHTGEIVRRLDGTYRLSPALCVKYIDYLKRADAGRAKERAVQMAGEFPDDADVAQAALGACGKADPEYAALSLELFVSTGDWKYYARMKESPSWSAAGTVRSLVDMGENRKAVEACIKEKMHDEGMGILESAKHLSLLELFAERLGKKYPARYFDAYAPLVRKLAVRRAAGLGKMPVRFFKRMGGARATAQKHNDRVRDHLLRIRGLGDGRYAGLVNQIRSKNSKNKPLLEAIRDV